MLEILRKYDETVRYIIQATYKKGSLPLLNMGFHYLQGSMKPQLASIIFELVPMPVISSQNASPVNVNQTWNNYAWKEK